MVDILTKKNEASSQRSGSIRVFYEGDGISTYESMAAVAGDANFDAQLCDVQIWCLMCLASCFLALKRAFGNVGI